MPSIKMRVGVVGGHADRKIVHLTRITDPHDEQVPTGTAVITLHGDDAKEDFAEGDVYSVSFSRVAAAADDPAVSAIAAARAIPNSTNTPGFVTPPELKVPPPAVPDGVVTLPRPSVIMERTTTTAPDAGVTTGAPTGAPVKK